MIHLGPKCVFWVPENSCAVCICPILIKDFVHENGTMNLYTCLSTSGRHQGGLKFGADGALPPESFQENLRVPQTSEWYAPLIRNFNRWNVTQPRTYSFCGSHKDVNAELNLENEIMDIEDIVKFGEQHRWERCELRILDGIKRWLLLIYDLSSELARIICRARTSRRQKLYLRRTTTWLMPMRARRRTSISRIASSFLTRHTIWYVYLQQCVSTGKL